MDSNQNNNLNESNNNAINQQIVEPIQPTSNTNSFNTNKKKSPVGLIIIIILLITLVGTYLYFEYYSNNSLTKDNDNTNNDKPFVRDTTCLLNDDAQVFSEKNLAILTSKKIDNFSNLDYEDKLRVTNAEGEEDEYTLVVSVVDNKIVSKYSECIDTTFTSPEIPNIKSLRLSCDCGGCRELYYLTTDKKLYSIELDHGCMYLDEDTNKLPETLIATGVTNISTIFDDVFDFSTCGGETVTYKSTDGNYYINYASEENTEKYNINNFQYRFIYTQDREASELYVINKNNSNGVLNDSNVFYVKDENGNKLYASKVFYGYQESCVKYHSTEELTSVLFVLTEDNKIYFLPKGSFYNDAKAYLFSDKTVKSIEDISTKDIYKVKITYSDNTFEEIETNYKLNDYNF